MGDNFNRASAQSNEAWNSTPFDEIITELLNALTPSQPFWDKVSAATSPSVHRGYGLGTGTPITGTPITQHVPAYGTNYVLGPSTNHIGGAISWGVDDTITLDFNAVENGQSIHLRFTPEPNMSVQEWSKITLLLATRIMCADPYTPEGVMNFVRNNNLERHFTIKTK